MKKIIATVLAMVMALALCVTAFAATTYAGYGPDGKEITKDAKYTYEKVDADYDRDHGDGNVAYYWVKAGDDTYGYFVSADAKSYDLKLTNASKAPVYLAQLDAAGDAYYDYKATVFTKIGDKCGQLDLEKDETGYVVSFNDETTYYVAASKGSYNLLVNGEVVKANLVKGLVAHDWAANSFDKNGNADSYKCKTCGTVAKVYETVETAEAAGAKTTEVKNGQIIGFTYEAADTVKTNTTNSPKTFDAGVAMYAGMALMSVAGSAVVRSGRARHFAAAPSFFKFFRKKRGSRRFLRYTLS